MEFGGLGHAVTESLHIPAAVPTAVHLHKSYPEGGRSPAGEASVGKRARHCCCISSPSFCVQAGWAPLSGLHAQHTQALGRPPSAKGRFALSSSSISPGRGGGSENELSPSLPFKAGLPPTLTHSGQSGGVCEGPQPQKVMPVDQSFPLIQCWNSRPGNCLSVWSVLRT